MQPRIGLEWSALNHPNICAIYEELIADLARIGALGDFADFDHALQGTRKTMPEIGRELNVDAIVEGSVLR